MIAIIFLGIWIGITAPILMTILFTLLKPILIMDPSGISMIVIALLVVCFDWFLGLKLYEKTVKPWLGRKKKKTFFH
ncbi:hypothetical protein CN918_29970 [Priestia megaterium]|nr:hypothetical protein CN918_29970 [Priestia megaterium]